MIRSFVFAAVLASAAAPALAVSSVASSISVLHSDPAKVGSGGVANLPEQFDTRPTSVGAVPEPGTWAMLIAGFGLVGAMVRRKRLRTA
jgi:hypothetical protein